MVKCVNGCGNLYPGQYEGIEIDTCDSCLGIWLDYSELTHIVKTNEKKWDNEYIGRVTNQIGKIGVPNKEKERTIKCPKCDEIMPPINYQYSSGVIVNKCKSNHGIWLDSGEIEKIQIYMEKWREKAKNEGGHYSDILNALSQQQDDRLDSALGNGPGMFDLINSLTLGIVKIFYK